MNQYIKQTSAVGFFVLASVVPLLSCQKHSRRPQLFLIPDGYVGWVRIDFRVTEAPSLLVKDGYYVFQIPPTGILLTASSPEEGYAEDRFYYVTDSGKKTQLRTGTAGESGMIWGGMISRVQAHQKLSKYFFIGPEQDFIKYGLSAKDADGEPVPGPITKNNTNDAEAP